MDTDPLTELRLLSLATRILIKTEQLTSADEQLIARQARNVLRYGTRLPASEAQGWDINEATFPPAEAPRPTLDVTPHPRRDAFTEEAPPFPGFTVEQRVRQLGYRLFPDHRRSLLPILTRRMAAAWTARFSGMPAQHQGQDWYSTEDAPWMDEAITDFMRALPITIHRASEEPR